MFRIVSTTLIVALFASGSPAFAAVQHTFATAFVQAAVPHGAAGRDAGVDVSQGTFVRISASGSFASRSGICGRSIGPAGCGGLSSALTTGTLLAAFADPYGRMLSSWVPVGVSATLAVPLGAKRLLFRANAMSGREYGAYRVVTDVVPNAYPVQLGSGASSATSPIHIGPAASGPSSQSLAIRVAAPSTQTASAGSTRSTGSVGRLSVGTGPSAGVIPGPSSASRSDVQYVLRRFGFSDTPANVTKVQAGGVGAWVTSQLAAPAPDADTSIVQAVGGNVEPLPVLTGNKTTDGNYSANIENRLMQWQVNTQWQLREKLTLHWLEHFSVSNNPVNQAGDIEHYQQTVRADALGNFAKLIADVSKEPAMMIWLDNANNGYLPNVPPNENFGRELMQLYTIGINALNPDGTTVPDPNNPGQPLANYTETDVKSMALALTGFQLQSQQQIGTYPAYVDNIVFKPAAHAPATNGGFQVMGQTIPDGTQCMWSYTLYKQTSLNTSCVVDNAALSLANNPTTWVFQSVEMLKRLVTETPSPAMIKRISTVWGQTVNDPNQIAKVVAAIAADPEFYNGKYAMIKEPIEFEVDAIRALGGASANLVSGSVAHPFSSAVNDTRNMFQELWYPPSVFSFYYPGDKSAIVNNAQLLGTWKSATNLANAARTATCANCNVFLDFTSFAPAKQTNDLAGYLLDALVDGGTPQLNALVKNFLNNNPANVQGALWIILSSPVYGTN